MTQVKSIKKWILNALAPFIEGKSKEGSNPAKEISTLSSSDTYSDLNEDTDYS
tara:strand:+ start:272 stop:430 length:159 start_codon:yes stop_codon:yes gene_type:complete